MEEKSALVYSLQWSASGLEEQQQQQQLAHESSGSSLSSTGILNASLGERWLILADRETGYGAAMAEEILLQTRVMPIMIHVDELMADESAIDSELLSSGCAGIVFAWGLDFPAPLVGNAAAVVNGNSRAIVEECAYRTMEASLLLMQTLNEIENPPRLVLVSNGATTFGDTGGMGFGLPTSVLPGLMRAAATDLPDLSITHVDISGFGRLVGSSSSRMGRATVHLLMTSKGTLGESYVIRDEGEGEVPTILGPAAVLTSLQRPDAFDLPDMSTYVLCGELSDRGLQTLRWLCQRGARHVACLHADVVSDSVQAALLGVCDEFDVDVRCFRVRPESAVVALRMIAESMPAIGGVVIEGDMPPSLLAGDVLDDENGEGLELDSITLCAAHHALTHRSELPLAVIEALSSSDFLDDALEENPFVFLFTSSLPDFGVPGLCGLSVADALLESAATQLWRKNPDMVVKTVRWTPWSGGVRNGDSCFGDARDAHVVQKAGIMGLRSAYEALERILWCDGQTVEDQEGPPVYSVVAWDHAQALQLAPFAQEEEFEKPLISERGQLDRVPLEKSRYFKRTDIGVEEKDAIRAAVSAIIGVSASDVIDDAPLMEQGLTSSGAVALTTELSDLLGQDLPATLCFDYPNLSSMYEYFADDDDGADDCDVGMVGSTYGSGALPGSKLAPFATQRGPGFAKSIEALVKSEIASVIGIDASELDSDAPLLSVGLTSASAVTVVEHLEEHLGVELPSTLVFDYPTSGDVVMHLESLLEPDEYENRTAIGVAVDAREETFFPVHSALVVASAARLPGYKTPSHLTSVNDLDAVKHVNAVTSVPPMRWDLDGHEKGVNSMARFGGFVMDAETFCAHFVNIGLDVTDHLALLSAGVAAGRSSPSA